MSVVRTLTGDSQLTFTCAITRFGKVDSDESNVFDAVQVPLSGGHNGFWLVRNHIIHDAQIVGRQIPDHVDVMLEKTQVHTQGIVVVEISQFSFVDQVLDLPHRTREQKGVVDHNLQVLAICKFDQFFCLRDAVGKWLFDKDMLSVLQRLLGQFIMGPDWSYDRYDVDIRAKSEHRSRLS